MPPFPVSGIRLQTAILLAYCFGMLAWIQFAGPAIVGHDGYYHIKVADLMRQQGLVLDFPWLQYTVLDRNGYTDHHWLFHLVQLPFTVLVPDLTAAAKWSAVAVAAFSFAMFAWLLLAWRIPLVPLWLFALFAVSEPFLFRMSMARGQGLALGLQLLAFHLLMKRGGIGLAFLAAVFVLAYNGFAILLPLAGFAVIAHWVTDRRIPWSIGIALVAGLLAGLLLHPYFPRNVEFLWAHIVPKLFATEYGTRVGGEWYPYDTWKWFTESALAVVAWLAALFLVRMEELKRDRAQLFWLLTAGFYFFLYLKSRRFAEYFPPAALLALAFVTRERLANWLEGVDWRRPLVVSGSIGLVAVIALAASINTRGVRDDIRRQPPQTAYADAAAWLATNSTPGETVFHADWDDFPRMFFHNTHNTYILGLDPDFMRLKYPELFNEWVDGSRGRHKDLPGLLARFDSRLVFTDSGNSSLIESLDGDSRFILRHEDAYTRVYELVDGPSSHGQG